MSKVQTKTERISKINFFLDTHDWQGINYPSEKDDWKKFEKKI